MSMEFTHKKQSIRDLGHEMLHKQGRLMLEDDIVSFTPTYQNYTWGKKSHSSLVSKYLTDIEEDTPYAELWIGAHQKSPGKISGNLSLDKLIKTNPENYLGDARSVLGNELPFLLKILSIDSPLSIQAHPDKELAKRLHYLRPDLYPDDNHKPEMGIALTSLDLLVGFKDVKEIKEYAEKYPAIKIAANYIDPTKDLKLFFKNILDYPKLGLPSLFNSIVRKLSTIPEEKRAPEEKYFLSTYKEKFPQGDHGLFCFFLFKFLHLQKGDAIEIKANTPHCYLKGDLLECMANSDNVVRAGLTTKHCDKNVLVSMLNYKAHEHTLLTKINEQDGVRTTDFITSVKDFKITNIEGTSLNHEIYTGNKPLIIFNLNGNMGFYKNNVSFVSCPLTQALFIPASTSKITLKLNNANTYVVTTNF